MHILHMQSYSQTNCPRLSCQEPKPAKVTRKQQLDAKGEEPGQGRGGKGRGRGRGRGRGSAPASSSRGPAKKSEKLGGGENGGGDYEWDEEGAEVWSWEKNWVNTEYGWFWVGECEEVEKPKKKPRTKSSDPSAASAKAEPKKKRSRETEKIPEKSVSHKKRRPATAASEKPGLYLPLAPDNDKDIKKEIYDFLLETKTMTEENAKDNLRKLVPEYKVLGYTAKLNIYWVRRKVKGVGVGITSLTEGQDVGFIGFKPYCPNWVTAIAAAIKAGDIFATFSHENHMLRCSFDINMEQSVHHFKRLRMV